MRAGWHPAHWLAVALVAVLGACQSPPSVPVGNLDPVLASKSLTQDTAALVVYRLEDGRTWTTSGERPSERFVAASTSKIPHTLIALETGAVSGSDEWFEWDGETRFLPGWNESQDFASAFQRSTVWIYQTVTPRIGSVALSTWLARFGYGNADTGTEDDIQTYWLKGPLKTSAREQVVFLAKLSARTLPLSARTYEQAIPMMLAEEGDGWSIHAKTGWKSVPGETDIGWYVGWLEQTEGGAPGTYAFAFNLDMNAENPALKTRKEAVRKALETIGALSPASETPF
ncbi:OXA-1090 family carbapenem-hydrolyzing class D beta-lactamase [Hyphomonas sp. UBA4494]|jgi:beta-lactamase class D|uniref:OXA-1090 family carbapenem-hydrolyzing class D beta-lactamase n=1 Tax=Hyphomonas sp. UBA4494 TaxID=1946631 RepID=UPI0025B81797|nr:OXA-1090 family carbapenem-hydrolyzing class D beta-lactamase [Hyphomonas sp. UBA4494]